MKQLRELYACKGMQVEGAAEPEATKLDLCVGVEEVRVLESSICKCQRELQRIK